MPATRPGSTSSNCGIMIVTQEQDPRRRQNLYDLKRIQWIRQHLDEAWQAAARTHQSFAGLVEPLWLRRYLDERIQPLEEECRPREERVHGLKPEAFNRWQGARNHGPFAHLPAAQSFCLTIKPPN